MAPVRKRVSRKNTSRPPARERAYKMSKALEAATERSLDRYIERWARKLLIVQDGVVRKLTEAEVQMAVRAGKTPRRKKPRQPAATPATRTKRR